MFAGLHIKKYQYLSVQTGLHWNNMRVTKQTKCSFFCWGELFLKALEEVGADKPDVNRINISIDSRPLRAVEYEDQS